MTYQPRSTASLNLPHLPYRANFYVGNDVKVIISLSGSDDGSVGAFVDRYTDSVGKAMLPEMLAFEYKDCDEWQWGCEDRNEFSSNVAAVGFIDTFSQDHLDAFASEHRELGITVYYESNTVVGNITYRNGKVLSSKNTLQRWTLKDQAWTEVSYADYVKCEGERTW